MCLRNPGNSTHGWWNNPDSFDQFVYVWVFPERFEIVGYKSNRRGKNVNDLIFTIEFRPRTQATYEVLTETLSGQEQVQVEQQEEGVRITVGATVLFASGSSGLTPEGKALIGKTLDALSQRGPLGFVIEGHTDNIPIKGGLIKTFPTNWELSAARALTVLHTLAESGIPQSRLEVRAHGSQRPIESNETATGRATNRRIELLVVE